MRLTNILHTKAKAGPRATTTTRTTAQCQLRILVKRQRRRTQKRTWKVYHQTLQIRLPILKTTSAKISIRAPTISCCKGIASHKSSRDCSIKRRVSIPRLPNVCLPTVCACLRLACVDADDMCAGIRGNYDYPTFRINTPTWCTTVGESRTLNQPHSAIVRHDQPSALLSPTPDHLYQTQSFDTELNSMKRAKELASDTPVATKRPRPHNAHFEGMPSRQQQYHAVRQFFNLVQPPQDESGLDEVDITRHNETFQEGQMSVTGITYMHDFKQGGLDTSLEPRGTRLYLIVLLECNEIAVWVLVRLTSVADRWGLSLDIVQQTKTGQQSASQQVIQTHIRAILAEVLPEHIPVPEEAHLAETTEVSDDPDRDSRWQCPGARLAGLALGDFLNVKPRIELAEFICTDAVVQTTACLKSLSDTGSPSIRSDPMHWLRELPMLSLPEDPCLSPPKRRSTTCAATIDIESNLRRHMDAYSATIESHSETLGIHISRLESCLETSQMFRKMLNCAMHVTKNQMRKAAISEVPANEHESLLETRRHLEAALAAGGMDDSGRQRIEDVLRSCRERLAKAGHSPKYFADRQQILTSVHRHFLRQVASLDHHLREARAARERMIPALTAVRAWSAVAAT